MMETALSTLMPQGEAPPLTETQAHIVQAALDLFAEHGYAAATTQAIAKRAGVTEKTLFRHFGTKKQLFAQAIYPAMLQLFQPVVFERLRQLFVSEQPSLRAMLLAIISDRIAVARERPEIFKTLAQEFLLDSEFREVFATFWQEQLLTGIFTILQQAKARGEVRDLPEQAMLRAIISFTAGYVVQRAILAPQAAWDDEAEAAQIVDILLQGIGASLKEQG